MSNDLKIELSQHYLSGIPGIDAQHKEIFLTLDGFINSLKDEKLPRDIVYATLQELYEHVRSHIFTEENLLDMISFPRAEDHKAQHRNFINLVTEEMKIIRETDYDKICRFMRSYRNIGLNHIAVFDHEYAEYITTLMSRKKKQSIVSLREEQAEAV